ncbi:unnamed protein product [Prunus armeniaca]
MMSSIGTTSLRCPPRPSFLCVLLVGIGLWSAHEWRWWTEPTDLDEITWAFSDPERDGFTSHVPKLDGSDGEVESSNVKAPQALCIHLTRELAIQNMEVLQKMGKYTGINAKCVVPTERTSSTSIQSRAPVSAQIVIGTHGLAYFPPTVNFTFLHSPELRGVIIPNPRSLYTICPLTHRELRSLRDRNRKYSTRERNEPERSRDCTTACFETERKYVIFLTAQKGLYAIDR